MTCLTKATLPTGNQCTKLVGFCSIPEVAMTASFLKHFMASLDWCRSGVDLDTLMLHLARLVML